MRAKSSRSIALAVAAHLALCSAGCSDNAVSDEAEAGLAAFTSALSSGDPAQIWPRLAPDTQASLDDAAARWQDAIAAAEQLQPSDREEALLAIGAEDGKPATSGVALLPLILRLDRLPDLGDDSRYANGLVPADIIEAEAGRVIIFTKSGQQFELMLSETGDWLIREPMHSAVLAAVTPVHENAENMERAVRLFGTATDERERLIRLGLMAE
ncbi:MAG: hypothetical protein ACJA1R_000476 [Flavobacteriales bacterium]|jgi:hypothetical protein